jgi:hypothetical protein
VLPAAVRRGSRAGMVGAKEPPAGAAPRGPRGWPDGRPGWDISKEARFVPDADLL